MAQEDNAPAEQQAQPGFSIEKIYVKDASLEIPNAPQIFTDRTQPQVSIELSNAAQALEDGVFEVALKVTVTSKIEDKTVFLVEVTQAGIFQIRNAVSYTHLDVYKRQVINNARSVLCCINVPAAANITNRLIKI